jgi:hypothetical protein
VTGVQTCALPISYAYVVTKNTLRVFSADDAQWRTCLLSFPGASQVNFSVSCHASYLLLAFEDLSVKANYFVAYSASAKSFISIEGSIRTTPIDSGFVFWSNLATSTAPYRIGGYVAATGQIVDTLISTVATCKVLGATSPAIHRTTALLDYTEVLAGGGRCYHMFSFDTRVGHLRHSFVNYDLSNYVLHTSGIPGGRSYVGATKDNQQGGRIGCFVYCGTLDSIWAGYLPLSSPGAEPLPQFVPGGGVFLAYGVRMFLGFDTERLLWDTVSLPVQANLYLQGVSKGETWGTFSLKTADSVYAYSYNSETNQIQSLRRSTSTGVDEMVGAHVYGMFPSNASLASWAYFYSSHLDSWTEYDPGGGGASPVLVGQDFLVAEYAGSNQSVVFDGTTGQLTVIPQYPDVSKHYSYSDYACIIQGASDSWHAYSGIAHAATACSFDAGANFLAPVGPGTIKALANPYGTFYAHLFYDAFYNSFFELNLTTAQGIRRGVITGRRTALVVTQNGSLLAYDSDLPTAVEDPLVNSLPGFTFQLLQNYPNPFNPTTSISYELPALSRVTLKVYDLLGRETATLVDEVKHPGRYAARWDASDVATGVYFYRLKADGLVATRKVLLVR